MQMIFDTDTQTLQDLAIFRSGRQSHSVFNLFNVTKTIGGTDRLQKIFNAPLTDPELIQERIDVIRYFQTVNFDFNIERATCDFIEFYLKKHYQPRSFLKTIALLEKTIYAFNSNNEYYVVQQGVSHLLQALNVLDDFANIDTGSLPKGLQRIQSTILNTLAGDDFKIIELINKKTKLGAADIAAADNLFRNLGIEQTRVLLDIIYQLDVFIAVGARGKELGFALPVINPNKNPVLDVQGLFHPFIDNPVSNDIYFNADKNVCFVTGTNMAGKSTFLKAIGVAVYLSQLGFPVPAAYMQTSTFEGLISTVNLADDIERGHSHFYSEVLRVKYVAEKMAAAKNILVIFDELFRGTNVKDAYDASLAIIAAFAKVKNCFFVVSTHIVEVANELKSIENINFQYMETLFDGDHPSYSYKLKPGITEERLGMWMVKNEGIIELIEKATRH